MGLQQHEGFVSLRQGGGPGHVPVLLPAQVCRSSYQSPSILDFACGCVPARLPTDRSVSRILGAPLQVLGSFPPPGTALTSSGGSLPARLQVAVIPAVLSQERACHIGAAFRFSQQKTTFWFTLQMLPRSSEDVVETLGSFGPEGSRADGGERAGNVGRSPCVLMVPLLLCPAVPPQIVNISSDITVNEGSSVTLMCLAFGRPKT